MKTVQFSDVPVGGWFKESEAGTWHLKTSSDKGMYQSFGTRYEPRFKAVETAGTIVKTFKETRPMMFPNTYGEVMRPLDPDQLPEPLLSQYRANPRVKEWVHIADRVRRAEKVSSWTQWKAEESAAYDIEDYRLFSRLRGYSEAEIEEFERFIALCPQVNQEMGDDNFCIDAEFAIQRIVETPAYQEVDRILYEMSQTASSGQVPTSNIGLMAQKI